MPGKYHMIDYIHEAPEALTRTLEANEEPILALADSVSHLDLRRIVITGIGSSNTASLMAAPLWLQHSRLPVHFVESSEFGDLPSHMVDEHALVIAVSRSGERGLVVDACRRAAGAGAFTVSITGSADCLLAQKARVSLTTREGPEITFPKTKSVATCAGLLMRLALGLAGADEPLAASRLAALRAAPQAMLRSLEATESELKALLESMAPHEFVAIAGTGSNYGVALEAAMKLQEASFIPTYGNSTNGLLNGPVGALNNRWLLILLVTVHDQTLSNELLRVAVRFGADTLVVAESAVSLAERPWHRMQIPGRIDSPLAALSFLPPMQLIAYYWTVARGMNPDAPASMQAILEAILPAGRQEPELRTH